MQQNSRHSKDNMSCRCKWLAEAMLVVQIALVALAAGVFHIPPLATGGTFARAVEAAVWVIAIKIAISFNFPEHVGAAAIALALFRQVTLCVVRTGSLSVLKNMCSIIQSCRFSRSTFNNFNGKCFCCFFVREVQHQFIP